MNSRSKKFAQYWRSSLAGGLLGKGAWTQKNERGWELSEQSMSSGFLSPQEVEKIFKEAKDGSESPVVSISLWPFIYILKTEHGAERDINRPKVLAPLAVMAKVNKSGKICPQKSPIFARDLLGPVDDDSLIVGHMNAFDEALTRHEPFSFDFEFNDRVAHAKAWQAFLVECDQFFRSIAKNFDPEALGYLRSNCARVDIEQPKGGMVDQILKLYDGIQTNPTISSPLFEKITQDKPTKIVPCEKVSSGFSDRIAHSGNQFGLADAQRNVINHLGLAEHGDVIAVNGPPGTGKTTMLLSVVANLWARRALDQGEPPVILAASTNNQAVTNIIDAFKKDFSTGSGPLAGRWISKVKSFGSFLPSRQKEKDAAAKGYQTITALDEMEAEELSSVRREYLEKAKIAFPDLFSGKNKNEAQSVKAVVDQLHKGLTANAKKIQFIGDGFGKVEELTRNFNQGLIEVAKKAKIDLGNELMPSAQRSIPLELISHMERKLAILNDWQSADKALRAYIAKEPFFLSALSWLGSVKRRRVAAMMMELEPFSHVFDSKSFPQNPNSLVDHVRSRAISAKDAYESEKAALDALEQMLDEIKSVNEDIRSILIEISATSKQHELKIENVDKALDTTIRFENFLLATHYWEGRWLVAMQDLMDDDPNWFEKQRFKDGNIKNTENFIRKRWHRRMMLAPCVVSTFATAPSGFMESRKRDSQWLPPSPMFDFIDLLIVDEAGQVTPETGAATFSLAKKALVIGDTLQIEPIWSVSPPIDRGNAKESGLINPDEELSEEIFPGMGQAASCASLMALAQAACKYHQEPDLARGLFLLEHRRCLPDIIDYCNQLCYANKLIAARPTPKEPLSFPAMGYVHVPGYCSSVGGGRSNAMEADWIARWIKENQEQLFASYPGQGLADIVAVVTPFKAQAGKIKAACERLNLPTTGERGITIGTVHSLQGAERKVVIFSPTYSKHNDGRFIDASPSMLNVAVSRAKDSFLVFGDMDLFDRNEPTPRGKLGKILFSNESNELAFAGEFHREESGSGQAVVILNNHEEHDAFIRQSLSIASHEISVVSPWVNKRVISLLENDFKSAVSRGVKIIAYVDYGSCTKEGDNKKEFLDNVATMQSLGIDVKILDRVHTKLVTVDEETVSLGSFNWLSANRERYAKHEISVVIKGGKAPGEAKIILGELLKRYEKTKGRFSFSRAKA